MRARWFGLCSRCGEGYAPNEEVVPHKDGWIHASCASGQDE